MAAAGFTGLLFFIVVSQASAELALEEPPCVPGFKSDMMILNVRKHLLQRQILGRVRFTDCSGGSFHVYSQDSRFTIKRNGMIKVNRAVTVHDRPIIFRLIYKDRENHKKPLTVRLEHHGHHYRHHGQKHGDRHEGQHEDHHKGHHGYHHEHPHHGYNQDRRHGHHHKNNTESETQPQVPELVLPKKTTGLSRRKRDWVFPEINVAKNQRGGYPIRICQIFSSEDRSSTILYSITGPGADQDPVGLFVIDRSNGTMFVTGPLDREAKEQYQLQVRALAEGSGNAEESMDMMVNVIDQNNNKLVFAKDAFLGEVPETSPIGFEVIQVVATDGDQPNSDNSDLRHRIVKQDPKLPSDLFAINPVTGWIRVNTGGLDREKNPKYPLTVQVADHSGERLSGETKVILTVTGAPVLTQLSTEAELNVPVLVFKKRWPGLKRRKRVWVVPPLTIRENDKTSYPNEIARIRSDEDKSKIICYYINEKEVYGPFTIEVHSGKLMVTRPLDREAKAQYRFQAQAKANCGNESTEEPMEIVVNVSDENDNNPVFNQTTYLGKVPEASPIGFEIIRVVATDADEPNSINSDLRYRILMQDPELPSDNLFRINQFTGQICVNAGGLDREKTLKYTLRVQATDEAGKGNSGETSVILTVTDSNDNAPVFTQNTFNASVPENEADTEIVTVTVTDNDDAHSPAWNAKFRIVNGDAAGFFTIKTGPYKQQGIISTVKGLDFERNAKYTLLVDVENEIPFDTLLSTATATVVVTVLDVNEAPIFSPNEMTVSKPEDLEVNSSIVLYTASDPDTARNQKVMYRVLRDPAGWLDVSKDTGMITVKSEMDRESSFVRDNKYSALIGAYDDDEVPATGTGTLVIVLEDVNDNAPAIVERKFSVCNKKSAVQRLSVIDKDGPGFAAPYTITFLDKAEMNWTAVMNNNSLEVQLMREIPKGVYRLVLTVADVQYKAQESTIDAEVCDCSGAVVICQDRAVGGVGLPVILGILGGILLLLMLLLLLLLFARRKRANQKEPLLVDDDIRDNIYYYDEEGGGEDDQDYDLGVLHRGLDNRPEVFRNDVVPNFMPAPQYRPRPTNPEEIGNFIDDNLKAADNDPTAPPYDSLLVFDYEGAGSDAGSLSSLNSSDSGDQDYDCLNEWGPRFKKLADMYGGGEDDDML